MSGALNVELDAGMLESIGQRLGATDGQIAFALQAAANHAARLAQRMGKAKMNDGLSVSAAALRRRLKMSTAQGIKPSGKVRFSSAKSARNLRARSKVWFGLNPVDPFRLSVPPVWSSDVKTRRGGVTAGRYRWDGAFIARRKKGNTGTAGSQAVFMRAGKERLPIVRQFADIRAKGLEIITGELFPLVAAEFYARFETELAKEVGNA